MRKYKITYLQAGTVKAKILMMNSHNWQYEMNNNGEYVSPGDVLKIEMILEAGVENTKDFTNPL